MRIFFWIGIGSFWIIQGLVATPVHASQTLMIDDLEAKGGCRALSMQTFDSELAKARFTLSVGRGIPKVFGKSADEISESEIDQIIQYGTDCFSKKWKDSDGSSRRYFESIRRDLASVTAFAKDAVRQEFAADQARARVQEQEALEARRREEQRAAEAEQQAQRREAERQLEEKRQRSESEQQARDAAEQAKKDQEAAVELRKQLEIERKRLDEAKKIAEDARRQREAAEQELLEVRQERKREELKGQSNAPPPASKAGTATSSPQFSENQPAPPESVPTGADSLRTRFITSDNHFGCKSRDTFDRIGTIADSGDREAFGRLLSAATIAEECIFWKKGAKVFVDDGGFATSCLRKQGETSCYWTVNEAIRRVGGGS